MRAIAHAIALGSMLLVVNAAIADEPKLGALIQTLPKDGSWIEFNVNVKVNGQEYVPAWSVRSVGQAFHSGKRFTRASNAGSSKWNSRARRICFPKRRGGCSCRKTNLELAKTR